MNNSKGKVYLIGAGPGDDGLLTVRGRELLAEAEVVLYDRLASPSLLRHTADSCEKLPVGKREGFHSFKQEEINALLIQKANEGKTVVRLKGGDPFVFGRGGEEILALETEGIPYEVVPGVTSATAALAAAGIPVTHREAARSFHVITGHTKEEGIPGQFAQYAALEGTLVFLMGVSHLEQIVKELLENGKAADTPASIVEQGTTIRQRRVDAVLGTILETAQREQVKPPAIVVIGQAAAYHMHSERLPLAGLRVGVTGTEQMTNKLGAKLREQGAVVYKAPYVRIRAREEFRDQMPIWKTYAWLVFTSSNGICIFFEQFYSAGGDIRLLSHLKFAVVGGGTYRTLLQYGIKADYMPEEYTVGALADGLASIVKPGERICVLRAAKGSKELGVILGQSHIRYDDFPIYDTVIDREILERLYEQLPVLDYLTFASASGAEAFLQEVQRAEEFGGTVVCIGRQTQEAFA
ncbi:MAG: uroporphyrinogen-III C-methyltransferase, partial [Lachnospiraceae bacterium]|nr:uroporphyrinogen-III C-methyltransferase [Lachnospiraceae bacterium]